MINTKRAEMGFEEIARIIIILVVAVLIFAIFAIIFKSCSDPNNVEDGIKCRILIQSSARLEELSQGAFASKLVTACPIIAKELPMRDEYPPPYNIKVSRSMSAEDLRKAIIFDFAELVNNAWWITGEGDRAEYLVKDIGALFVGQYNCYTVYAAKIEPPGSRDYTGEFQAIDEEHFLAELKKLKRSELKGLALKGDQRDILTYVTLDNKGAGVFFKTETSTIQLKEYGSNAPAIYGVAVGFADESGINKLAQNVLDVRKAEVKKGASFIFIAPYDEVIKYCKVI